jgi:hypothetical protein
MTNEEYQARISNLKSSLEELHQQLIMQKAELAKKIAEEEAKEANKSSDEAK